jgi:hypothetical protein
MSEKGFTLDTRDFDVKFKYIVEILFPGLQAKGLFNAMAEALHDADYEQPYLPVDKGDLRGSKKISKSELAGSGVSIEGGFNSPYAAKWHELEPTKAERINWSRAGSGPKFLESKLIRNRNKYMKITADTIAKGQKL